MFNIFKKEETEKENSHPSIIAVACLLIHSARIDENYTNKENFVKLIKKMNYKTYEKDNSLHFKYSPSRKVVKKDNNRNVKDNPFNILAQLNLK